MHSIHDVNESLLLLYFRSLDWRIKFINLLLPNPQTIYARGQSVDQQILHLLDAYDVPPTTQGGDKQVKKTESLTSGSLYSSKWKQTANM